MLAREIAEPYPVVDVDARALDAARILASRRLPGLVVTEGAGLRPVAVLPASQLLRAVIPGYVRDDPSLARVLDERHADELCAPLRDKRVRDLLPGTAGRERAADRERAERRQELPVVQGDDQVMEIAALMAELHSPLVAVIDDGRLLGVVTAAHLLELLLPDA